MSAASTRSTCRRRLREAKGARPPPHINQHKKRHAQFQFCRGRSFYTRLCFKTRFAIIDAAPPPTVARSVYLYAVVKDAFTRSVVSKEIGSGPDRAAAPTLRGVRG